MKKNYIILQNIILLPIRSFDTMQHDTSTM